MIMTQAQFKEGVAYAEDNFRNDEAPHLRVDKQIIRALFDLEGKKVLDFGCGMGGMSLWYARTWDCKVHALDIDSNHIQIAQHLKEKHGANNITFERRDVLETPLTEKYDCVFLNDVAEHIPLPILKKILSQLSNCLNPNGVIFITYPPWRSPYASHVTHVVKIPWCQFLPQGILYKLIEKNNQEIIGDRETDLLEAYKGLNKLTHNKLMDIISDCNLQVDYRKSHCFLNNVSALKDRNINFFPLDFFVTKEFVMLKRANGKQHMNGSAK